MWKDDATLVDIDDAARRIGEFIKDTTFEQFLQDDKTWSAVLFQIEVIGEAVKRLSDSLRDQHPEIPWPQMAAMRNRVIHGYDSIDFERVWLTVTRSIPALRILLSPLLPKQE